MAKNNNADAAKELSREFPLDKTIDIVENNLRHQLDGDVMYIPVWCGKPGMGKTTHARKIAEKLKLDLYYVSMYRPTEFFEGLPIPNSVSFEDNEEKKKNLYLVWSEPEIIHIANTKADEAVENGKKGVLIFLDDLHIMSPDVQKCFFELVLERALGNYKLRDNCCILGAMNSSALAGFDGFLSAINNRIQKIYVNMPFEYWYINCGAELNPLVAGYVRCFKDALEEEESTDEPFATYRSWVQLSKIVDSYYEEYKSTHDTSYFLNKVYTIACSLMSQKLAQSIQSNISQQLTYNYEYMVVNNKYYVDKDDSISQFSFANIVRYLRNAKDVENLTNYLIRLINSSTINIYEQCIISVMYEVKSFMTALENKKDEESKKRYDIIKEIPRQLFNKGKGKVHEILRRLTDTPFERNNNNETKKLENRFSN